MRSAGVWSKTELIVVCDDEEEKKKYKEGSTECTVWNRYCWWLCLEWVSQTRDVLWSIN